ncbi:hypothetical protein FS749_000743 [Ceratobasidium sp. UAMH 11750]|nr:hypothetical protein FS749_000743 [Ceratobasidium sp. UAMH 11750]
MNDPTVITPALAMSHLAPTSKTTTFWRGNKSEALNGRCPTVATGQLLGGGSSINFTMYARASASDYDDWNTSGWKSNDLLPLLRKTETYHLGAGRETHGYDGPAHVSYADCYAAVAQEYLDVVAKLGVPLVEDVMNLKTGHGCQRWAKWINPETGHRQDAAHCFVHPLANNKSLHILTKTKVTRVLFDGTKATGVEIIANREQDADADPTPLTITARKLVVVSAGAIGTPLILQRSGIGLADRLSTAGVKTLVDLPGVGATYEDHTLVSFPFHVPDDTETFDSIFNQDPANMERLLKQFAHGKGLLASNLVDAGCKMRPDSEDRKEMGDEFNQLWENYFEPKLDKPVMVQAISNGFPGPREAIYKNARLMGIGNFATYPTSRGSVYITSADPYAPPDFDPRLFDRQVDVDIHVWGYKKAREVARRMPHYRGEYVPMHPKFLEGSAAACAMYDSPPDAPTIKNIEYTAEDNAAIEAFIRQFGETCWHSCATVPMKAREQNGCLDPRLNVYGTQNLKVSDLSILPGNVGANTYSTALLVGEKAAMLIAEDLGLKSP